MFTWLALLIYLKTEAVRKNAVQSSDCFHYTNYTHFLESLGTPMPVTENFLAGKFFNKIMTICKTISVSTELLQ